jgi:hypothetical protein
VVFPPSAFPCMLYVSSISLSWFDYPNNIWWRVQFMKLLIMQSFPASRHYLRLWSKYSPQHPVLLHPQSMLLS